MEDMLLDVLESMGFGDWDADDVSVTCPEHGNRIEHDAETCGDGCTNPVRALGLI
jgi:hypothetical protein